MAETVKLFYEDTHLNEFDATVISCQPDGDTYKVVLDRTAFFPEGGGQYGDIGFLNDVKVIDTKEKAGIVYHRTTAPLNEGEAVHGKLDWEVRFERMQQHSAEHIISGIVHNRFGYDNVGFHLGEDYCTMDFNGPITKEQLKEIEIEANEAVFKDLDIQTLTPSKEELKDMVYRSKIEIEGQVRIINIPGYDTCACCAPHLTKTGEIGLIKLVDMANYKGGERINMLSGRRALKDYVAKQDNAKAIGSMLCAKENEIAATVEKMKEEQVAMKGKIMELEQQLLTFKAQSVDVSGDIVCVFDSALSGNGPREMMNILLERGAKVCAIFAGTDNDGYRYVIGSKCEDVRPVSKLLNGQFNGRGGGKPEMVQGSLKGMKVEIEAALK